MKRDILAYLAIEENDPLPLVLEKIEKSLKGNIEEEKLQQILLDLKTDYKAPLQNEKTSSIREETMIQGQEEKESMQSRPKIRPWIKYLTLIIHLFQIILTPLLFFFSLKTIQDGFELEDASLAFYDFLIMASFLLVIGIQTYNLIRKKRFLMVKGCELRWLNMT